MNEVLFYQCELARGNSRTVGWIPKRGAIVGARIELKEDDNNLWEVLSVSDKTKTASELNFHRQANKHPSLGD